MPPSFSCCVKRLFDWVPMSSVCLNRPCPNVWRCSFHALWTQKIFSFMLMLCQYPPLFNTSVPHLLTCRETDMYTPPAPPTYTCKRPTVMCILLQHYSVREYERKGNEEIQSKIDFTGWVCVHAFTTCVHETVCVSVYHWPPAGLPSAKERSDRGS